MASPPTPAPPRVAVKVPWGSFGQIVAAVAGAGVFLYLIGVVVLWEGLERARLHPRDVIATIPRDQIAVFGARESLLSALAGAVFALYLYGFYRLFRFSERAASARGIRGRLMHRMNDDPAMFVTAIVAVLALFGPADAFGVLLLVLFLVNLYLGMRSAHRSLIGELPDFRSSIRPWLRVAAGLTIAVAIASVARQHAFPEQFSIANVTLNDGSLLADGLYLGASADTIVIGQPPRNKDARCGETNPHGSQIVLVPPSTIRKIELTAPPDSCRPPGSLARHLLGIPVDCIAPICQVGNKPNRVSLLSPFGSG